jgi:hypothetical protein
MSSGVSGVLHECAGCHRIFKRLASHIVQSPMCQQVYVTCQDDIPPNGGESNVSTGLLSRRSTRWLSSTLLPRTADSTTKNGLGTCNDVRSPPGDACAGEESTIQQKEHIDDDIEVDDDDGAFGSSDDPPPWSDEYAEEGEPNKFVKKLYEELL